MSRHDARGLTGRVWAVLGAKVERMDPARIFEAALERKVRAYEELKAAVAGILYLRNKIEGEIRERRAEIARIHDDIRRALELSEESEALAMVRQKQALAAELARAEEDLSSVSSEGAEAKARLLEARETLRALERERHRAMTTLAGARARVRVGDALHGISDEDVALELEAAREEIARMTAERTLDRELSCDLDDRISTATDDVDSATTELAALKKRYLGARVSSRDGVLQLAGSRG
jgi:phage shock protein A